MRKPSVVAEKRKSAGRPRQEPEEGQRVVLSFKITPELKRRLDAAADQNGRSSAQECELRLDKSFEEDRLSERFSQLQGAVDDIADYLKPLSLFRDTRAKFAEMAATASDLSKKPPHKGTKAAVRDSKGQLITATTKARVGRRKIKKLPGAAAGGGKVT